MPKLKLGEPFGLDAKEVETIDWNLALGRVIQDLRSDFVYAPHLGFIYSKAGEHLIGEVKTELKSGKFKLSTPITIEVPKSFRIRVQGSKRLGPYFSRPGSILPPRDRLFYQALADQAAPIIDAKTNHHRSFSHKLAAPNSSSMFLPTRTCWSKMQAALSAYSEPDSVKYVMKLDVANYFGSLNQHTMINVLSDSGYNSSLAARLEVLFTSYTGERSSRGILQGMYPSDLFGNFYLEPLDRALQDHSVPSARYVDDIYLFLESVDAGEKLLRELIPTFRSYDLVLNEAKCRIVPKKALATEEPDLEALFNDAIEEVAPQVSEEEFDADYGFQSEWEEEEVDEEDLELQATTKLFDSIDKYPGQEENIERFCLPLFAKSGSDHAVEHVRDAFKKRASMAQIYVSYLAKFLEEGDVGKFLIDGLKDADLADWQRMWIVAALLQGESAPAEAVTAAVAILKDGTRHEALRAVAAILIGKFGDHTRRKGLSTIYSSVPEYVKAAIYYSSRWWQGAEKSNAKAMWGSHGQFHELLTVAFSKGD